MLNEHDLFAVLLGCLTLSASGVVPASQPADGRPDEILWPTRGWARTNPAGVGLDEQVLDALDKDLAAGKFPLNRQLRGIPLRPGSLREHLRSRLHTNLRQTGEGTKRAQCAPYGAV